MSASQTCQPWTWGLHEELPPDDSSHLLVCSQKSRRFATEASLAFSIMGPARYHTVSGASLLAPKL
jgi:hypothetical protein